MGTGGAWLVVGGPRPTIERITHSIVSALGACDQAYIRQQVVLTVQYNNNNNQMGRAEPDVRPPGAASPSGKSTQVFEIPLAAMAAGE